MKVKQSEIEIQITDNGIRRVTIAADNAAEQAQAHRLLARIAGQMVALDTALKSGSSSEK